MRRLFLALAVSLLGMLLGAATAGAATIVPAVTQDSENGSIDDLGCTLRDAVQAANTNTSEPTNGCIGDSAGADTIILQSGQTYTLTVHGVDDTNAKGDLDITGPLTIRSSGPGLATIDARSNLGPSPPKGADRAIDVLPTAGSVTLEGVRIYDGLHDNGATIGGGGGILNEADLTIRNSEVVLNESVGTEMTLGGGIYSRGSLAHLTVSGSTVAENKVVANGPGSTQALGGGIASYKSSKTLTITNSTVSGNASVNGGNGGAGSAGGVFSGDYLDFPAFTMTNATITGNHADYAWGGIDVYGGVISGSLMAGNTEPEPDSPDCFGSPASGGGNLLGNGGTFEDDCGFTGPNDLVGTVAAPIEANLGTLVDNGGPTRTEIPNPGSPAIDRGGSCPETDQRGLFRAAAAPCDSGAVEVGATVTPPATPTPGTGSGGSQPPPVPPLPPVPLGSARPVPARVLLTGKATVKTGARAALVLQTGIEAICPAGGDTCNGSASIAAPAVPKRTAGAAKAPKVLGAVALSVPAGTGQTVRMTLSRKTAATLRAAGSLKVAISVSITAPGTVPALVSRRATLAPPKPASPKR